MSPINFLFRHWKRLLSKLLNKQDDRSITESELLSFVQEAETEGAIDEDDRELIYNVIDFNDEKAGEIYTPRVDIVGITQQMDREAIAEVFRDTGYSRVPVYEGSLDNITGVVHLKDFFNCAANGSFCVMDVMKPVLFTTPAVKISDLLKQLQQQKSHLAVVADEYGGTLGIVTMEDILEELVGDIWDEHDEIEEQFVPLEGGAYKVLCSADVDDLFETMGVLDDDETDAQSVGGWVMQQLGSMPRQGDTFACNGLRVRVLEAEHNRAIAIEVHREEIADDAGEDGYSRLT